MWLVDICRSGWCSGDPALSTHHWRGHQSRRSHQDSTTVWKIYLNYLSCVSLYDSSNLHNFWMQKKHSACIWLMWPGRCWNHSRSWIMQTIVPTSISLCLLDDATFCYEKHNVPQLFICVCHPVLTRMVPWQLTGMSGVTTSCLSPSLIWRTWHGTGNARWWG